jgi:signal transduction histidine kinase/ligand-binding sensor domain-containing protein
MMFNRFLPFDRDQHAVLIRLAFCGLLLALSVPVANAAPVRPLKISQLLHTTWTARDGAPQAIRALAEAPNGSLWVGTSGGLFNFNGLTFQEFKPNPGEPNLPSSAVESLYISRDGTLWVGFFLAGVAKIRDGHVTLFDLADGSQMGTISNFQQAPDGSLWALASRIDMVHLMADGKWHRVPGPEGPSHPLIYGFWIDSRGTLWVPRWGHLYKRATTDSTYQLTSVPVDMIMGGIEAPDGTMWVTDALGSDGTGRTQHLDSNGALLGAVNHKTAMWRVLSAPDGSLWMASPLEGLFRIPKNVVDFRQGSNGAGSIDRYVAVDGLTSDGVGALLLDSSGNIWVGGDRGLDRFRPGTLTPFVEDRLRRAFVCANRTQRSVLIAVQGSKSVYLVSGESVETLAQSGEVYSIACGPTGEMWLVDNVGIWRGRDHHFERIPMMPGFVPYGVHSVLEGNDGTLFVSVNAAIGGYWTYKNGIWGKLDPRGASNRSPLAQFMDDQGRLWAGYNNGTIVTPLSSAEPMSAGDPGLGAVTNFLQSSGRIFATGLNGLAVFENASFRRLAFEDREAATGLTGLADTKAGDLWMQGARGIVHVPKQELLQALADSKHLIKSEILAEGDFVGPAPIWPATLTSSVARDSDDRIWFMMLNGIASLDSHEVGQVPSNSQPPRLSILSIQADGKPLSSDGKIQPDPQTLLARYFGVDLTAPEKVSYKYQLEGLSESWQEVGQRTEAIYTNLHPGTYTFRVMATNGDGKWASASSSPFTVQPDFFQSVWFLIVCAVAATIFIWFFVAMRIRYIAKTISSRAEERADERIRIARDLHDTLLQGVQGLMLNIHVATESLRSDDKSKAMLQRALSTADSIIIEGRNRVASLRSDHVVDAELAPSLKNVANELGLESSCSFQIRKIGLERVLKPHVADEIFFIGREALTNAFRHAAASRIEIDLDYGRRAFKCSCMDNGRGISAPDRSKAEGDGHWGLRGMAERAAKSKARFDCETEVGQGTKIIITVPARHAYQKTSRLRSLLRRVVARP